MKPLKAQNQRLIREIRAIKALKIQEFKAKADRASYNQWKAETDAAIAIMNKITADSNARDARQLRAWQDYRIKAIVAGEPEPDMTEFYAGLKI